MKQERLDHHLNSIKMCSSDLALRRCIERIFEEGNQNGWDEANECVECHKKMDNNDTHCEECIKGMGG